MDDNTIIPIDSKHYVMESVGATRERSWKAVAEALDATKLIVDKFGEEHVEIDHTIRLRAAELIGKATGDIKADNTVTTNIQNVAVLNPDTAEKIIKVLSKGRGNIGQTGEIIDVGKYRE